MSLDHMPINRLMNEAERLISQADEGTQVVFIFRYGDRISIRDNSGVTGLCDESLMDATEKLLKQLFPKS